MDILNADKLTPKEQQELNQKLTKFVGDVAATEVENIKIGNKTISGSYNGATKTFTVNQVNTTKTEKPENTNDVVLYPPQLQTAIYENKVKIITPKTFEYNNKKYLGVKAILKALTPQ